MSRVDAIPKVLGQKVFVRDLRAPDIKNLPGTEKEDWGNVTWHALLLRASYLQRTFAGIHLPTLSTYRASKCFVRDGDEFINSLDTNERYTLNFEYALFGSEPKVDLFVSIDESASYVGQPVALLLFDDVANFLNAEREQLGIRDLILYGPFAYEGKPKAFEETNPIDTALDHWVAHGIIPEDAFLYGGQGVAVGKLSGARFSTIEKSLQAGNTVRLRTSTQMVDPAFLEPDASLGKVEKLPDGKYSLTMFAPTQSPNADEAGINVALGSNITASKIDLRTLMLGGGFGGRDFSTFPIYGAVAALVAQGTPVRLVLDRYSQFVSGTKRHASTMQTEVAFADDGHLLALRSKLLLDGGSQKDLTTSVRGLALHSATGAYRYDHWDLRSLSMRNSGPLAGSMRGFGIPQVLFNVEQVIDQIAFELKQDPIEYRKGKVLNTGDLDAHKQFLYHDIRNAEILTAASNLPLWTERNQVQSTYQEDHLYGVGFAMAMEAFGTSKDGSAACLTLTNNNELVLHSEIIEMGQGAVTGLADIVTARFGARPDMIDHGNVEQLLNPIKSKPKAEIYTKIGTTAASKSIFFQGHVIETLVDLWFANVWFPAAASIWNTSLTSLDVNNLQFDTRRSLSHPGLFDIPWATLCEEVRASNKSRIWGHGSFHGVWAWARFEAENNQQITGWLDALAFTRNDQWPKSSDLLNVLELVQPDDPRYGNQQAPRKTKRTVYASGAWVIAVEIHRSSGKVKVCDAVCVLDAGDRVSDSLVKGQMEGSFAQGLGFALTEDLPLGAQGGQRLFNFDTYAIPRWSDMPTSGVQTVFVDMPVSANVLNAITNDDPAPPPRSRKKGIAEIGITPVAPAIANAVFHALSSLPNGGTIDTRLTDLPMRADLVRRKIEGAIT